MKEALGVIGVLCCHYINRDLVLIKFKLISSLLSLGGSLEIGDFLCMGMH